MHQIKNERTCLIIKPDGVVRGKIGEIISRVEQRGLKIVALNLFQATREQIDNHYPKDPKWIHRIGEKTMATYKKYDINPIEALGTDNEDEIGQMVRGWLIDYLVAAPMVKMVVEGVHAIDMVRKLVGNTMPYLAEMGTIRGDFSVDSPVLANIEKRSVLNLAHASEIPVEAEHEIAYWFSPDEIVQYERSESLKLDHKK